MTETEFGKELARIHSERDGARLQLHMATDQINKACEKLAELHEYLSSGEYVRRPDDIGLYFQVANVDYLRELVSRAQEMTKTIKRIDRQLN